MRDKNNHRELSRTHLFFVVPRLFRCCSAVFIAALLRRRSVLTAAGEIAEAATGRDGTHNAGSRRSCGHAEEGHVLYRRTTAMVIRSRKGRRCQDCVFFLVVLAALSVTGFRGSDLEEGGGALAESIAGSSPASALRRRRHSTAGHNHRSQDRLGAASDNAGIIRSSSSTSVSIQSGSTVQRSSRSNSRLGVGGEVTPLYIPFVDWDPPPLLPGWWRSISTTHAAAAPTKRPATTPPKPMHELCAASLVKVYMPDVRLDFGALVLIWPMVRGRRG